MIGYFDYTVVLTYGSLVSAVLGIFFCMEGNGHPYIGVFFLLFSGLCDAFDGKVARTKKNRTTEEKRYGIQIDSLADLVAFGVLPVCIGHSMLHMMMARVEPGRKLINYLSRWPYVAVIYTIMVIYVLTALIRLAYFNVEEEMRAEKEGGVRKYYTGLPVTSASLIFALVLSVQYVTPFDVTPFYFVAMLIVEFLFVMPIPVKKPGTRGVWIMVAIGAIDFILMLAIYLQRMKL